MKTKNSFKDVQELTEKESVDHANGGNKVQVPSVHLLVGGFPCKDVSFLNCQKKENDTNVWESRGKTGKTLFNICRYQQDKAESAIMSLYENVVGLAAAPTDKKTGEKFTIHESNLAATLQILKDMTQQTAFAFQVDPRLYAHPQSRPRLYIPAFRDSFLEELRADPVDVYEAIKEVLFLISGGYGIVDVKRFLIPNEHPAIQKYLSELTKSSAELKSDQQQQQQQLGPSEAPSATSADAGEKPRPGSLHRSKTNIAKRRSKAPKLTAKKISKMADQMKWPSRHHDYAASRGMDWSSSRFVLTPENMAEYPGLRALTERELDALAMSGARLSENTLRTLEVSQSLGRSAGVVRVPAAVDEQAGGAPKLLQLGCVTPRARWWLTSENRLNHGMEALNMMGIHYGPQHDDLLMQFGSTLLSDLAGNAFHSGCCGAIFISMFTAVGMSLRSKNGLSLPLGVAGTDEDEGADEEEMSAADAEAALDSLWAEVGAEVE